MLHKSLLRFNQLIKRLLLNQLNKIQHLNKLKIRNKKLLNLLIKKKLSQFKIKKLNKKPLRLKFLLKLQKKSTLYSMMVNNTFISLKKIKLQLNQLKKSFLPHFVAFLANLNSLKVLELLSLQSQ